MRFAEFLVAGDEVFGGLLLQFGAQGRVGRYVGEVIAAGGGLYVEAAAAAEDRRLPARDDVAVGLFEIFLVLEDIVFLAGIGDVDQVLGDVAVFGQILARADVHSAVHLP